MKSESLVKIQNNLQSLLNKKAAALPQNFNQTRFLQNCMVVLQDTKDIDKYTPASIARTMLKGAFLDLDFFNKECYAIPYGNQLQFQTDYKGEIKIIKKYSIQQVKDVYAKLVRVGDKFQEKIVNGMQTIDFIPKPFNNEDIIGVFAVCLFVDDSMVYETMSVEEVEKVRDNYSKQPKGQAWEKSFGEMAKKTVLRRLKKWIPIEFKNSEQYQAYEDASDAEFVEIKQNAKPDVDMPEAKSKKKDTKDNGSDSEKKEEPVQDDELNDMILDIEAIMKDKEMQDAFKKRIEGFLEKKDKSITQAKMWLDSLKALPDKS
jgi:recombination protein RecT